MTDLERFFYQLVRTLADTPTRLREPLQLADIRGSIVPYRTHRRALEIDSSEDYEIVVMRLCVGEGGFARTGPDDVRLRFEQELASPNPDLNVLRQFGDAFVSLSPRRVSAVLEQLAQAPAATTTAPSQVPEGSPAVTMDVEPDDEPPLPSPGSVVEMLDALLSPPEALADIPSSSETANEPTRCVGCQETLPDGPPVKFCPFCGKSQLPQRCSGCGIELEPAWRFCTTCGRPAGQTG